MTQHTCEYCGDTYPSIIAAALCCDPISNDLHTETPTITRGYD